MGTNAIVLDLTASLIPKTVCMKPDQSGLLLLTNILHLYNRSKYLYLSCTGSKEYFSNFDPFSFLLFSMLKYLTMSDDSSEISWVDTFLLGTTCPCKDSAGVIATICPIQWTVFLPSIVSLSQSTLSALNCTF